MTVLVGNHDFLTGCKLNGDSVLNAEFCLEYVEISTNGVKDIVGGYKNARFADLFVHNPRTGLKYLIQVGKTTKAGIPVARELKAIYDLQLKGWLVKFFSYN